ncbi:MAG: hypothetical protein J6Q11_06915 [Fibrobacteraceae bacterium]|nr:hypothetical protein [Fibrobacteraceae bacterium]
MEQSENKLTSVVFENLKELIKGKNAAHESMFKFHWKKLWPFNLIWPQVDYLRIQRFMENIGEECQKQKEFIKKNKSKATNETETNFLNATLSYLDALKNSCEKLSAVADFKQKLLEKTIKRDVFAFNKILKEYEQAQTDLVRAGAFVRIHWGELKMQESNG